MARISFSFHEKFSWNNFSHREALHEHVSTIAIAEFLLSVDLTRLLVVLVLVVVSVGGVGTLPAAGLVHVGAVLSDGVCAALSTGGVEALHGLARLAGGRQVQAVHPAVR